MSTIEATPREAAAKRLDAVWLALCDVVDQATVARDIPLVIALGELCSTFARARDSLGPRMQVIQDQWERAEK